MTSKVHNMEVLLLNYGQTRNQAVKLVHEENGVAATALT